MVNLKKEIENILSRDDAIALEGIAGTFISEVDMDEERWDRKGRDMLTTYLNNDIDAFCVAVTGWSMYSLLARAGVIQDP